MTKVIIMRHDKQKQPISSNPASKNAKPGVVIAFIVRLISTVLSALPSLFFFSSLSSSLLLSLVK